ncbi:spermidine/putrescine ABC transporter ATP-binding protein [Spiroplasma turonicum]|uniref:Spermidine/putrescine ABC transporter ATP-binding protein n=1 Tax=Spiroplasma turonicum TaxID=216946 RepID=A0A0K1P5B4_9MOLU|nr:spermidine/putrescine ABC transporter ATP-binding protein [Spiroplasma turonicum]AKU79369.1 spermidine/putrescine ABC transporter ATP-binding protein [Spiroplasma turonicum]ALX70391.1 spermidine/putrescine ABC transporter ATP-binding protein [Spiroplasma turonicum]
MKNNKNILEIRDLTKSYDGKVVLKGVSFNVKEGEFITLLGPSGCGKSTTLNIIGGREKQESGQILFEGKDLTPIPSNKRQINTIFQNYALFPHYDVYDNIAYGLRIKKTKEDLVAKEVSHYIKKLSLEGLENKRVHELSGGQKQRVAIARALILKPRILLLDEPMSALDVHLRKRMQDELKDLQEEVGITFILVTHDQEEALTLSDRIVVINDGAIQQIGTPEAIYNEPENRWVAKFIGSSNIIENGEFIRDMKVKFDGKEFDCTDKGFGENQSNIDIVIRPEDVLIDEPGKGYFDGIVENIIFKGVHYEITIKCLNRIYKSHTTQFHDFDKPVSVKWASDDLHVMWKEVDE